MIRDQIVCFHSRGHYPERFFKVSQEELNTLVRLSSKKELYESVDGRAMIQFVEDNCPRAKIPSFVEYS